MNDDYHSLHDKLDAIDQKITALQRSRPRGIRKRSARQLWGLPWYDIALGPDPEKGERWGHAKGIVAIGDIATGVLALGNVARGVVALGALALGLVSLGGGAVGILAAMGGLAIGGVAFGGLAVGIVAYGGLALGAIAVGGEAIGYYALGGGAVGKYTISATHRSREAFELFSPWFPGLHR